MDRMEVTGLVRLMGSNLQRAKVGMNLNLFRCRVRMKGLINRMLNAQRTML